MKVLARTLSMIIIMRVSMSTRIIMSISVTMPMPMSMPLTLTQAIRPDAIVPITVETPTSDEVSQSRYWMGPC